MASKQILAFLLVAMVATACKLLPQLPCFFCGSATALMRNKCFPASMRRIAWYLLGLSDS